MKYAIMHRSTHTGYNWERLILTADSEEAAREYIGTHFPATAQEDIICQPFDSIPADSLQYWEDAEEAQEAHVQKYMISYSYADFTHADNAKEALELLNAENKHGIPYEWNGSVYVQISAEDLRNAQNAQPTMIDVTDILNTLDLGDYAEELNNYRGSSSYICDTIQEIADSNTSIYYSDIKDYIAGHIDDVTDAIDEFGWDGCGNDLYKAGQTAEYMSIEREIWDHSEDAITMLAVNVLAYDMDMKFIPEAVWDEITDSLAEIDCNSRFDEIDKAIADIVGGK